MTRNTAAEDIWVLGEGVSRLAEVLIEADEQLTCGTDLDRLRHARENLNAVAPRCLLVRMLDYQIAARVKAKRIPDAKAASLQFQPIQNARQQLYLEEDLLGGVQHRLRSAELNEVPR